MEYQEYCETDRNQRKILKKCAGGISKRVDQFQFIQASPKNPATDRNAEKEKSKENIWFKKEIREFDDEKWGRLKSFLNLHGLKKSVCCCVYLFIFVVCICKLLRGRSEGWGQNWFLWELIKVDITKQVTLPVVAFPNFLL
jgi:hypothetical protein